MDAPQAPRLAATAWIGIACAFFGGVPGAARGQDESADTARFTLAGEVLDAWTGAPLIAAVVKAPELRRFAMADVDGRFRFEDFPSGTWNIVAEQLGYHAVEGSISVREGSGLVLRLTPDPIELEGFHVRSPGERLIGRRRLRFPLRVATIPRSAIARSVGFDPALVFRKHANTPVTHCPAREGAVDWGVPACVAKRGRLRRIAVFLDEAPLPEGMVQLSAMPADDIHSMDWIPATAQLRVYTTWFVRRLDRGKSSLAPLTW